MKWDDYSDKSRVKRRQCFNFFAILSELTFEKMQHYTDNGHLLLCELVLQLYASFSVTLCTFANLEY